jgi:hypothetical protein
VALQSPTEKIYMGQATPQSYYGKYNHLNFAIQMSLAQMQTATIVKVVSCTNDGDLSPVGYVDVIPQVNQTDGNKNAYPHGTIFNVPYLRMQGGANAIIIDPVAGDLGICVFASRDLSNVKSTKNAAPPASDRKYDFADGMYLGGLLNGSPTTYIQFQGGDVTIKATTITLDGDVTVTGAITATGDVEANNISLENHTHPGVQTGGSNTGAPNP